MLKQASYAIVINAVATAFFLLGNWAIWDRVNYWVLVNVGSVWSPFFVTSKDLGPPAPPSYSPIYGDLFNSPFIIFFVLLAVNLVFFIWIGKNKK